MEKIKYNLINILVILVTTILFFVDYMDWALFSSIDMRHIGIIIATIFLVHLIKAMRLYLILYGSDLSIKEFFCVYCKVTPVSVVLPFKTGELFRMYCYGKSLKDLLKGCVIVLLDRFMDTVALVTMIILIWFLGSGQITSLVYILLLFLAFSLLLYYIFPGVYKFWKLYILRAKATEHKLHILKSLELLNNIYREIANVSKGRGIILFLMSLGAWGIEIGSLVLLNGINQNGKLEQIISDYLMAAIGIGKSTELLRFVCVSVIMAIAIYIGIKLAERIQGKKA